jgi:hypothetical protein
VKGIMADINIQGQVELLLLVWQSPTWRPFWDSLGLAYYRFTDFGLNAQASDALVWQACQDREVALITANRNKDGPDSLEATISTRNTPRSLPVFTLADVHRFDRETTYVARTAVRLLEHFLDIEKLRGTGRLYVP